MKYFVEKLTNENVALTGYIHDVSEELSNAKQRPAVLIFPGGGYFNCSDREAEPVALAYLAAGYQAFVLKYSVGKEKTFEQAFFDAKEAFSYLKNHAEELCIRKDKIAVAGFSAGGHLAAALGTMSEENLRH